MCWKLQIRVQSARTLSTETPAPLATRDLEKATGTGEAWVHGRKKNRRRAASPRTRTVAKPPASLGQSPGTTTTNGTSPRAAAVAARTADRDARAGHREGGGSPGELAVPAFHWAPLQTCPSCDRNKVGHKA